MSSYKLIINKGKIEILLCDTNAMLKSNQLQSTKAGDKSVRYLTKSWYVLANNLYYYTDCGVSLLRNSFNLNLRIFAIVDLIEAKMLEKKNVLSFITAIFFNI